jgi:membrane-associated phospholipid phosphatase
VKTLTVMTNPSTGTGAATGAAAPLRARTEPPPSPDHSDALFEPSADGPAQRAAARLSDRSPLAAGAIVTVASYVVLSVVLLAVGWTLTRVLFPDHPAGWDIGVNRWFADHRNATANDLTSVGSNVAETMTVIGIAAVVVAILGLLHRWRAIAFLVTALVLEVTVFLTTTMLVDRDRPAVHKLDAAPPTSSFPSGHTAAAVVLYVGLALIVTATVRNPVARAVAWIVAIAAPAFVIVSRLYRGMHFPTDVSAGALLGMLALLASMFVVRTAVAVAHQQRPAAKEPIA